MLGMDKMDASEKAELVAGVESTAATGKDGLLILPLRLFTLLCGVDVSDQLPPHRPVLHLLARQSLLPIYTVHPPPLRSSFPSPLLHVQPHHSFPHIFIIPP